MKVRRINPGTDFTVGKVYTVGKASDVRDDAGDLRYYHPDDFRVEAEPINPYRS